MPSTRHFLLIYLLYISIICQVWSLTKQPRFHLAPTQLVRDGQNQVQTLQKEASKENFLDRIVGTDCYSKAIDRLSDCKSLDQEQKSRLAFKLTGCQLAIHGEDTMTAGGETTDTLVCPPSSTLKTCLQFLSNRAYAIYVEFLTHIDSMCIFLQNQEFDEYTRNTLNNLSLGMSSTLDGLEKIHSTAKALSQDTSKVLKETTDLAQSISQQKELTESAFETIKAARQEATIGFTLLSNKQQETITLQETSIQRHHHLAQAQKEAKDMIENNGVQISSALDLLVTRALELAESQAEAHSSQIKLSQELSALAHNSHGIRETLDTVQLYQQRSDAALIRLLGKSYRFQDVSWYIGSFLVAIACGAFKMTASARSPLIALLAINWLAERYVLDSLIITWTDFSSDTIDFDASNSGGVGDVVVYLPRLLRWLAPASLLSTSNGGVGVGGEVALLSVKWGVRRAVFGLAALVSTIRVLKYKDLEVENFNLLKSVEEENKRRHVEMQADMRVLSEKIQQRITLLESINDQQHRQERGRNSVGGGSKRVRQQERRLLEIELVHRNGAGPLIINEEEEQQQQQQRGGQGRHTARYVPKREDMDGKQRSLRKGKTRKSSEADGEETVVKKRRKVGSK